MKTRRLFAIVAALICTAALCAVQAQAASNIIDSGYCGEDPNPDDNIAEYGKNLSWTLTDDGVIISNKIADLFSVQAGDTISLRDSNDTVYQVKVSGVALNYVSNYIYISNPFFTTSSCTGYYTTRFGGSTGEMSES